MPFEYLILGVFVIFVFAAVIFVLRRRRTKKKTDGQIARDIYPMW